VTLSDQESLLIVDSQLAAGETPAAIIEKMVAAGFDWAEAQRVVTERQAALTKPAANTAQAAGDLYADPDVGPAAAFQTRAQANRAFILCIALAGVFALGLVRVASSDGPLRLLVCLVFIACAAYSLRGAVRARRRLRQLRQ
jgi:hypothetical protein